MKIKPETESEILSKSNTKKLEKIKKDDSEEDNSSTGKNAKERENEWKRIQTHGFLDSQHEEFAKENRSLNLKILQKSMMKDKKQERTSCTSFVRCNDMWLAKDNRFLNPMVEKWENSKEDTWWPGAGLLVVYSY